MEPITITKMETQLPDCVIIMRPNIRYEIQGDVWDEYEQILDAFIQKLLEANKPIIFEKDTVKKMIEANINIHDGMFNGSVCEEYRKIQKETIQEEGELRENMSVEDMDGNITSIDFVLHIDYGDEEMTL